MPPARGCRGYSKPSRLAYDNARDSIALAVPSDGDLGCEEELRGCSILLAMIIQPSLYGQYGDRQTVSQGLAAFLIYTPRVLPLRLLVSKSSVCHGCLCGIIWLNPSCAALEQLSLEPSAVLGHPGQSTLLLGLQQSQWTQSPRSQMDILFVRDSLTSYPGCLRLRSIPVLLA
ncbi:hypothetical protein OE88DRAFT_204342 [Heliocybe sulcata]|uniref:Uncharacterized protein n=1 Tax=Heliocybe sulcata TaxID=5364 RepID=A0A5C3N4F3_9AGAM|nr:hypothetical protein OE88DRAFT_204342 [Heliocybe sulcata]